MRNDILQQAQAIREAMDNAGTVLTDTQAVESKMLYPVWSGKSVEVWGGTDGIHPQTRVRGRTSGLLYKCRKSHTTQEDWPPELTPALWAEVAEIGEYREIKDNMLPTEAFKYDEVGWYKTKDNLWRSKLEANTYTPETYPSGWEQVTG